MTLAELQLALAALPCHHPLTDTNVSGVECQGNEIYFETGSKALDELRDDLFQCETDYRRVKEEVKSLKSKLAKIADAAHF